MNPRLSYYGDLGEMGKERTMKVRCDHWQACTSTDCGHMHEHEPYNRCTDNSTCRQGFKAVHCIPVDPERVGPFVCTYSGNRCYRGQCVGCPFYKPLPLPSPSPGLLQRMGMATWEEEREWFVMAMPRSENAGWMLGTLMTKDQAEKALSSWCLRPDCDYRILHWQDGLR